jgi:hypothetical protein
MRTLMSTTPEAPDVTEATDATDAFDAVEVPEAFWSVQPVRVTTAPAAETTRGAARAHTTIARVLLGGVALQIFFAGLAIFGVSGFLPHMILGPAVILGSLALPLVAWRSHLGAALTHRSWLVFALMLVQGLLIDAGRLIPFIAAFHPVNAMLLVLLLASMAHLSSVSRANQVN